MIRSTAVQVVYAPRTATIVTVLPRDATLAHPIDSRGARKRPHKNTIKYRTIPGREDDRLRAQIAEDAG